MSVSLSHANPLLDLPRDFGLGFNLRFGNIGCGVFLAHGDHICILLAKSVDWSTDPKWTPVPLWSQRFSTLKESPETCNCGHGQAVQLLSVHVLVLVTCELCSCMCLVLCFCAGCLVLGVFVTCELCSMLVLGALCPVLLNCACL